MVPDCEREGLRVACPKAATSRSATVSPPGRLTTDAALITVNGQIAHIVDMSNESSHNISVVGSTFARPLALINGRVRTMGRGGGTAILLANGRVVRVGTDDDIRALAGAEVDVIDLAGRAVIPGLIDAHAHLLSLGLVFRVIDARYPQVESLAELVRAVEARARQLPEGEWVRGRGFDHAKYPEGRAPTRWDLDRVTDSHPVFLVHVTGHHALVNTRALELAGINDDVRDPKGGHFVRDASGQLTGLLLDGAIQSVVPMAVDVGNHGPNHLTFLAPGEDLVHDIDQASRAFIEAGVTTVVDPQVTRREMRAYIQARHRRSLNVRVHAMYLSNHLQDLVALGLCSNLGDDRLSIGPLKIYCDGALLGSSADFYEPYRNDVDRRSRFWTKSELAELIGTAHAFGLQVGVHAQGDRAISDTVDAIAHAQHSDGDTTRRHRLEHCGCPGSRTSIAWRSSGRSRSTSRGSCIKLATSLVRRLATERSA